MMKFRYTGPNPSPDSWVSEYDTGHLCYLYFHLLHPIGNPIPISKHRETGKPVKFFAKLFWNYADNGRKTNQGGRSPYDDLSYIKTGLSKETSDYACFTKGIDLENNLDAQLQFLVGLFILHDYPEMVAALEMDPRFNFSSEWAGVPVWAHPSQKNKPNFLNFYQNIKGNRNMYMSRPSGIPKTNGIFDPNFLASALKQYDEAEQAEK